MTTYLIPTAYSTGGKTPIEYRVETRKRDMRTTFCKKHAEHEVDVVLLLNVIACTGAKIKYDRVIMRDAAAAYNFKRLMRVAIYDA